MPAFVYEALDADGRTQRGVLVGESPKVIRSSLRERGLAPVAVVPAEDAEGRRSARGMRGLSAASLSLLTRQLATLVAAGLPMDEALHALADGSDGKLRETVAMLRARVLEGSTLADAMSQDPESFPPMFRASVGAGEAAGRLDRVLSRLADYTEARDAVRRKVSLALAYPILLTSVALCVVAALMVWVVPQVITVFAQQHAQLPWPTRVLLDLSSLVRGHGLMLLGISIAVPTALWLMLRQTAAKRAWHRMLLRLPLIGGLIRAHETARFARTLALLVSSAVPLLDALGIATRVVQNRIIAEALNRAAVRVREGQAFARALAETGEFPPVALRLIASGERSGRLDEMLAEGATYQERQLETILGIVMAVLGPAVIMLVGGMVLFIVLAILLPIFELNSLIR